MKNIYIKAILASVLTAASSLAANIVSNPGFETGNLSSWNTNPYDSNWTVTTIDPNIGTFSARTGCVGSSCTNQGNLSNASYLYQNLATTIGQSYNLSFSYQNVGTPSELKVLWGGSVVLDLINVSSSSFQQYSVANLVSNSTSTQLMFLGRNDPSYNRLDNISVEASAAPEPAAMGMIFGGLGLLAAARFRKGRRATV